MAPTTKANFLFVATITVNAAPVITCPANITVSNASGICGATVDYPNATVTGTPTSSVSYSIPSGSAGITVDGLGTYKVQLTDVNDCKGVSPDFVLKANPNFQFFVYPNPNSGQFQVRFYSHTLGVKRTLKVYDSKGGLIWKKEFTVNNAYEKMDVDISRNTHGLYIVELRDADGLLLGTGSAIFNKKFTDYKKSCPEKGSFFCALFI